MDGSLKRLSIKSVYYYVSHIFVMAKVGVLAAPKPTKSQVYCAWLVRMLAHVAAALPPTLVSPDVPVTVTPVLGASNLTMDPWLLIPKRVFPVPVRVWALSLLPLLRCMASPPLLDI